MYWETDFETIEGVGDVSLDSVVKTENMFTRSTVQTLDVTNWGLRSLKYAMGMFGLCRRLKELRGSGNWRLSQLEDATAMFESCKELRTLDVTGWDMGTVHTCDSMFSGCESLQDLVGSGNWSLKNLVVANFMFSGCESLEVLHAENWDLRNLETAEGMFMDSGLKTLYIKGGPAMMLQELEAVSGLEGLVPGQTYKLDGEVYDRVFEEQMNLVKL